VTETRASVVVGAAEATRRRRHCDRPECGWRGTTYELLAHDDTRAMRGISVVTADVAAALEVLAGALRRRPG